MLKYLAPLKKYFLAPGCEDLTGRMMNLFNDFFVLNYDITQHEIESLTGLNQKQFAALINNFLYKRMMIEIECTYQYLWNKLLLRFHIAFEDGLPVAEHIALLFVIRLLEKDQTSLSFS